MDVHGNYDVRAQHEAQRQTEGKSIATRSGERACAMGCGQLRDLKHRVLAECCAMTQGRDEYLTNLTELMHADQRVVSVSNAGEDSSARAG